MFYFVQIFSSLLEHSTTIHASDHVLDSALIIHALAVVAFHYSFINSLSYKACPPPIVRDASSFCNMLFIDWCLMLPMNTNNSPGMGLWVVP